MLLSKALRRNPGMVETAINFHQRGIIPADCYFIDLDAIAVNANILAKEAEIWGLRTYLMTKSHNRNPYVTGAALERGINSTVAVDAMEARVIHRFGLPVGHVGHLSNISRTAVPDILAMEPEVVTVFTYEAAQNVSQTAQSMGRNQNLYVRVSRPGDNCFRGMVGGWTEEECVSGIGAVADLPNVTVIGLTTFASISYDTTDAQGALPTDSFFTMLRAKERLERELGLESLRVNAPANNNAATLAVLARNGATDVEPGIGLMGSSLAHAFQDLAEMPAQVYVTEVMHHWDGEANLLLGGLTYYTGIGGGEREYPIRCATGSTFDEAKDNFMTLGPRDGMPPVGHATCSEGKRAKVGDSAVFALRAQLYGNRAPVAIVSGISSSEPNLEALFDSACNALDKNYNPIATNRVKEEVEECIRDRYSA